MLYDPLLAELDDVASLGLLGRFPAVLGRLPAVVWRDVVVVVVVVADRRDLGRERAGETPLFTPFAGDALLALIAAAMMSGDATPVPAGEAPGS